MNGSTRSLVHCFLLTSLLLAPHSLVLSSEETTFKDEQDAGWAFAKISTDIVFQHRSRTLAGYYLIFVDSETRLSLAKDSDLGPFLRTEHSRGTELSLVVLPQNSKKGATYCVYFTKGAPTAFVEIAPHDDVVLDDQVSSSLIRLQAGSQIPDGPEELYFIDVELTADDGSPIPAMKVLSGGWE